MEETKTSTAASFMVFLKFVGVWAIAIPLWIVLTPIILLGIAFGVYRGC